ncbi:MAG: hypothetical protein IPL46_05040 [Saprospiraceae bacterium]|nr:hypothetical protein [Saprospiraceae bacterium]
MEKLYGASRLSQGLLLKSHALLSDLNGNELGQWLKLYNLHSISDPTTCRAVVRILNSDNYFIANKAYSFLIGIKNIDQQTDRALRDFENKKR